MKYKIVLVPFPFDDFTGTKVRPALCLTEKTGKHNHIVIAFITSKTPGDKSSSDIVLEKSNESGLKIDSVLRLHRLTTIPFDLIKRQLGTISDSKKSEIKTKLIRLFELQPK
jgi:mRNA interferase MazF